MQAQMRSRGGRTKRSAALASFEHAVSPPPLEQLPSILLQQSQPVLQQLQPILAPSLALDAYDKILACPLRVHPCQHRRPPQRASTGRCQQRAAAAKGSSRLTMARDLIDLGEAWA
ncbi:hypothetical protein ACJQWK_09497 [Exserohilum turcicum]